jgi:3-hydroxyisobutyrate dehydrogenase
MHIGFVGLGIMGRPMALNLLKAGFAVTVYNRTQEKMNAVVSAGAQPAKSAADAAARSEIVITMVSDTPDVEDVIFGKDGVSDGVNDGQTVIDMSSISPSATEQFAARLKERNVEMLDAPVTGGEKGAIEGTLSIMIGGQKETYERCLPIFQALGRTIVYAGSHGNGQRMKLVNQMLCAQHIVAMSEALRFARKQGLDVGVTLKAVSGGAAGSWMLSNLAPKVLENDFAPGFSIRLQQKDLRLVNEALEKIEGRYCAAELAYQLFTEAIEKGLGELGTQGFIKVYQESDVF